MRTFFVFWFALLCSYPLCIGQSRYELSLKLNRGDKFEFNLNVNSVTEQQIQDSKVSIETTENFRYILTVTDRSPVGIYTIKMLLEHYDMTACMNDIIQSFNSDSTGRPSDISFFKEFMGKAVMFEIDSKGMLKSFNDSAFFFNHPDSLKYDDETFSFAQTRLGKFIPLNILSQIKFPDQPVLLNEYWNNPDTVFYRPYRCSAIKSMLIVMNPENFTVKGVGKIDSDPDTVYKTNRIFISYHLNGNIENTCKFAGNTGMLTDAQWIHNASGNAGVRYSEQSQTAYQWPLTMKTTFRLTSNKR